MLKVNIDNLHSASANIKNVYKYELENFVAT